MWLLASSASSSENLGHEMFSARYKIEPFNYPLMAVMRSSNSSGRSRLPFEKVNNILLLKESARTLRRKPIWNAAIPRFLRIFDALIFIVH